MMLVTLDAAAKAGMQGLARQMAVDYAQHKVRVNCVSPGAIETGLNVNSQELEPTLLPKAVVTAQMVRCSRVSSAS
eukprot:SAG31_NODE_257_length_18942_cov_6.099135_3_plen_76_part_00